MKVSIALALMVSALFAGCTSSAGDADEPAHDDLALAAAPVLYLNLTIGNETHRFTTATAAAGSTSGSHSSSHGGNATGTSASGTPAKSNSTTVGNATASNATAPGGLAPLNVTATLGAKGLPTGKAVSWTLDFGEAAAKAGNATAGNATGASGNATKGNTTAKAAGPANGTKVPAALNHTYTEAGSYNVTFTLRVANGTPLVLRSLLTVTASADNATGNATAFGPPPETIVITGSASGVLGEPFGTTDETFDLSVPVASMTITLDFDPGGCAQGFCAQDLDWSIAGPGGESAEGINSGPEDPVTFELPTTGTWTVTIDPYAAIETGYTITVTFA
ncbi:MAG: hypothetical protein ACYC2H_10290 [Thermoplasmatota archaeon]